MAFVVSVMGYHTVGSVFVGKTKLLLLELDQTTYWGGQTVESRPP
jgi:hypothetical protein